MQRSGNLAVERGQHVPSPPWCDLLTEDLRVLQKYVEKNEAEDFLGLCSLGDPVEHKESRAVVMRRSGRQRRKEQFEVLQEYVDAELETNEAR